MNADHKAALEWVTNGYHNHAHSDCAECNLAAAYLERDAQVKELEAKLEAEQRSHDSSRYAVKVLGENLVTVYMERQELGAALAKTQKELDAMRFLAANPHSIQKVKDELGPLSLWTQSGLEDYVQQKIAKCFEETRERAAKEAIANIGPEHPDWSKFEDKGMRHNMAYAYAAGCNQQAQHIYERIRAMEKDPLAPANAWPWKCGKLLKKEI